MKVNLLLAHLVIVFLSVMNAINADNDVSMIGWVICSAIWGINIILDIVDIAMD